MHPKLSLTLLPLILAACASTTPVIAGPAPVQHPVNMAELQRINSKVNSSISYRDYTGWDLRYLPNGGAGNCATIAYTKLQELRKLGYGTRATLVTCSLYSGIDHAFVLVDGHIALDNRASQIRDVSEVGCGSLILTTNK